MESPIVTHMKPSKRIIRYVKKTLNYGLFYTITNDFRLFGFSGSDWGDVYDRQSTSGFVFFMGIVTFVLSLKKQLIDTLSTYEIKSVVVTSCVRHVIFQRKL